jgi:hypothetical protein
MKTKICKTCGVEKEVCEFGKLKTSKDKLMYSCKECSRLRGKKYRTENYDKTLESVRKWTKKNPEWVYNRHKKWRENNPEKIKEIKKNWLTKNPHKKKEYRENYRNRKNEHKKQRRKEDPIFHLKEKIRTRLWKYLKIHNITKKNKTFEIVGCTPQELKEHLEKKFEIGMTWDNRSEWHIDHIIPLSLAKTEEELYKLCHYTNLQPLWAVENMKKGNKIVEPLNSVVNE